MKYLISSCFSPPQIKCLWLIFVLNMNWFILVLVLQDISEMMHGLLTIPLALLSFSEL